MKAVLKIFKLVVKYGAIALAVVNIFEFAIDEFQKLSGKEETIEVEHEEVKEEK